MIQMNSSVNVTFTQTVPGDMFYGKLRALAYPPPESVLNEKLHKRSAKQGLELTRPSEPRNISSSHPDAEGPSMGPRVKLACGWLSAYASSSSPWLRSSGSCFVHRYFPQSKLLPAVHGKTYRQVGRRASRAPALSQTFI